MMQQLEEAKAAKETESAVVVPAPVVVAPQPVQPIVAVQPQQQPAMLADEPQYFKNLETTLRETLISAQRLADETVAEARKKANTMVANAEEQAAAIEVEADDEGAFDALMVDTGDDEIGDDGCASAVRVDTTGDGYADTIYAPEIERIQNPARFTFMLAPISRSYTATLPVPIEDATVYPYNRNKPLGKKRKNLSDFLAYGRAWRKTFPGASFIFEYYFWTPQYRDPSSLALSKRIREDIFMYRDEGYEGILEDGSQRSYFPTGFPFYLYSRQLFDTSLSYEEIAEEYFSAAFGEDWKEFYAYLEKIKRQWTSATSRASFPRTRRLAHIITPRL